MDRSELEPQLVHLLAGLRRHQVEEAVRLLLDRIEALESNRQAGAPQAPEGGGGVEGHGLVQQLLAVLGLDACNNVTGFDLAWDQGHGAMQVTIKQLVRRPQGQALVALFRATRFMVAEATDLGLAPVPVAPPAAAFLRPTMYRPVDPPSPAPGTDTT